MASAKRNVTPARRSTPSRNAGRETEVMATEYTAAAAGRGNPRGARS